MRWVGSRVRELDIGPLVVVIFMENLKRSPQLNVPFGGYKDKVKWWAVKTIDKKPQHDKRRLSKIVVAIKNDKLLYVTEYHAC